MKIIEIQELLFADDMVIVAESEELLQRNLNEYQKELERINMEINTSKTKTMIMAKKEKKHKIELNGQTLEQVTSYNYLGTIIENNGKIEKELLERIEKVGRLYNYLRNTFFGKKEIPKEIKTQVGIPKGHKTHFNLWSESWILTKNQSRIKAAEMRFISWCGP